jgi:hypothetical protein
MFNPRHDPSFRYPKRASMSDLESLAPAVPSSMYLFFDGLLF